MKITSEIEKMYETLSPDNIKFFEYVNENPDCFKREPFQALKWDDPTTSLIFQPWPAFIRRQTGEMFEEASTKVFNLILGIPARIFGNESGAIGAYLGIPPRVVEEYMDGLTARHLKGLIGRGDFILGPLGLKCLEFNIAPNLGGWQLPFWESMYLKIPLIAGFLEKHRLRIINKNLLNIYLGHFIDRVMCHFTHSEEINILVLTDKGEIGPAMQSMWRQYIEPLYKNVLEMKSKTAPLQGEVIFCDLDRVAVKGEALYYNNKRIHMIIDYHWGKTPPGILELYKMGRILLINGPISDLLNNKLHLALLSEHEESELFTKEERTIIKKYIPWTRRLEIGRTTFGTEKIKLEEFVDTHRESLVIKPANLSGGESVYIGCKTPAQQWRELAAYAFQQEPKWLVQEYIQSHPYLFQAGENGWSQYSAVWGLFVFGTAYGGVFMRVLPRDNASGIINAHQGAQGGVVFEVDQS